MTNLMSDMMSESEFLEHYGKKGMKWGVIKDQAAAGNRGAQKKLNKADAAWNEELHSIAGFVKVNNAVADKMNGDNGLIAKHNANPKYKTIKDYRNESDPKVKQYFDDFEKVSQKAFQDATVELYGSSPSGRYSIDYQRDAEGNGYLAVIDSQTVKHSAMSDLRLHLKTDPSGRVLGIKLLGVDNELKHVAMMSEGEFLEHYGKKGMKWGQRKAKTTNPTHVSADAARVRKIETRLKKNGPSNLSNDDIAKLNKRSQLMSEYKKNNPSKIQKGHKATKEALGIVATVTAVSVLGVKAVRNPIVRKGARVVADLLKDFVSSGGGPANGGNYVQVVRSITS